MTDGGTKYILEYRYGSDEEFRFEAEFNYASDAHEALVTHIDTWKHIEVQVRKVTYVAEERVVGHFQPIDSGDYE